ncbi:MAG: hypothetical protein ACXWCS_14315 [Burkholderiales bacterium]
MKTLNLWFYPCTWNDEGKQGWESAGCCDEEWIAGPGMLIYSDDRTVAVLRCYSCKAEFTMVEEIDWGNIV